MAQIGTINKRNNNLLKMKCFKNNVHFLLDSGASLSVWPYTGDKPPERHQALRAANGSIIQTYGEKTIEVDLGIGRILEHNFIQADVSQPILGADFLIKYGIVLDLKRKKITISDTGLSISSQAATSQILSVELLHCKRAEELLKKFPDLVDPTKARRKTCDPSLHHEIITNGKPPHFKPRKLNPAMRKKTKEHFEKLLKEGVVERSTSNYAAPLHIVAKKEKDEYRFVGDFRALNEISKKNRYPLPLVSDCVNELRGKKVFTSLDLKEAFSVLPLTKEAMEKTAVITPCGLYQYRYLCYGLCNASQSFQRFIDKTLRGIKRIDKNGEEREVTTFAYVDDILISSESEEDHQQDLEAVFQRLDEHGLTLNAKKCQFFKEELTFLGHVITKDGTKPIPDKVQAIQELRTPKTLGALKSFLGMTNFYHRYMKSAAEIMKPLNKMLKGYTKTKKNVGIDWSNHEEALEAFQNTKKALAEVTVLAYPDENGEIGLFTDASSHSMGASLQQYQDGAYRPLGFFSKEFTEKEKMDSTFGRELTAIFKALKYFRHLLQGNYFTIFCDHQPIIRAFEKSLDREVPKESRMLSYISQFDTNIVYLPGSSKEIQVADYLSRQFEECGSVQLIDIISQQEMKEEQEKCPHLQIVLNSGFGPTNAKSELKLEKIHGIYTNRCNGRQRPFVPKTLRYKIFTQIHTLSHNGVKRTQKQIQERYCWNDMRKDIAKWVRACHDCQRNKIVRHNKSTVEPVNIECQKFSHINMDLVGPLVDSYGYRYILTIIDQYSAYPVAIPLRETSTETILDAFLTNWISHFGVPEEIKTDRGAQFKSKMFAETMTQLGIKHVTTLAYNPRANFIERLHRTLKVSLRSGPPNQWIKRLSFALLSLRTSFTEGIQTTPSCIVFGQSLRLPGEMVVRQSIEPIMNQGEYAAKLRRAMASNAARKSRFKAIQGYQEPELDTCTHVYVRNMNKQNSLQPHYIGPFLVLEKHSKYFKIQFDTRIDNVVLERLKAAFLHIEESSLPDPPIEWINREITNPGNDNEGDQADNHHEAEGNLDQTSNEPGTSPNNVNIRQSDDNLQKGPKKPGNSGILKKKPTNSNKPEKKKKNIEFAINEENIRESFVTKKGRSTTRPHSYRENP